MEPVELARKAVEAASDKQAIDIVMLDTRGLCTFADYFVICSGDSERQIEAIYDEIHRLLRKEGVALRRREGTVGSGWILMDFGDIIIHIFALTEREYYQLERLWSKATPLVRIE
ncbi:MAG: ribosome silencing factor [Dehalococcoidia bacterium]|nr:MAG: ribosome silencing factor [Dehalococcoidia bacterium]